MKKAAYILGIVCVNITLFGMLFKMNHWPGAGILIILGILLFSFGFLPTAIYSSYKGSGSKNKALYISGFITAFIIMLGVAFKVQHWPGSAIMLIIGIPLPFVLFLPVYIYFHNKEQSKTNTNFLGVMLLLVYIAVYSALLSINVSRNILLSFDNYTEEFTSTSSIYEIKNNAMYVAISASEDEKNKSLANEIKIKSDELCRSIDANKVAYVDMVEGENPMAVIKSQEGTNIKIDLSEINKKDQICSFAGNDVLTLKNKIISYRDFLKGIMNDRKVNSPVIDSLLNTNDVENSSEGNIMPWERELFFSKYLVSLLANFSLIQNNIRMAESEVLSQLSDEK